MKEGFGKASVKNPDAVKKILKQYRSIKKYMKSSLYQIKVMDGTETIVRELLEENQ